MPVKLVWSFWNLSVHFLCLWKLKILAVQLAASTPLTPASLTRHRLLGPALRHPLRSFHDVGTNWKEYESQDDVIKPLLKGYLKDDKFRKQSGKHSNKIHKRGSGAWMSVGWESDSWFHAGHNLRVLKSSTKSGSVLRAESAEDSLSPCLFKIN